MSVRFQLDENINSAVANGLRRRGVDVRTTAEAGMTGSSDEQQLAAAAAAQRVLVTHDDDLLRLHARGLAHWGIVYCHPRSLSIGQIVLRLVRLWRNSGAEDLRNRIEFL